MPSQLRDQRLSTRAVGFVLSATALHASGSDETSLSFRDQLIADVSAYESLVVNEPDVSIELFALVQFRYIADVQDQRDAQEDLTLGFVNSRTRVGFKGKLEDKNINFCISTGFTGSGSSTLLDTWVNWRIDDTFALKAGQFKLPTWQEWTISEATQTFVERSVVDARFAQLYSQGVMGTWTWDRFRVMAALSDGVRSANDGSLGNQFGASARAELLLQGDWSQRNGFNSFRDEDPFAVIGIAGHHQDGATLAGAGGANIYTNDTKINQVTADVQWGFGGSSIYAGVIGNFEERPGGTEYDQWGAIIQGQMFVTDDIEIFARYEWGELDGQAAAFASMNPGATTSEELNLITLGASKYISGHAMKFTADVGYAFDEVSGAWGGGGRGWQGDDAGADA